MESVGKQLFHDYGISQASCFESSCFEDETRLEWTESFAKLANRGKRRRVRSDSMLLVLSQNCDIAASDERDNAVEIAVCKSIDEPYLHNQFAHSSRKLHFEVGGQWYEANADYILTVLKVELVDAIQKSSTFDVKKLSPLHEKSIPVWRANRYLRSGLPDSFNEQLTKVWGKHINSLDEIASCTDEEHSSYIRALYVKVDPMTESEAHSFELFALLRHNIDDSKMSDIQDAVESWAEDLTYISGFIDASEIYADRESNTFVSYLSGLLRLNLDYLSLSQSDGDVGPNDI
ncbi:hypothetical protein N9M08_02545 [Porticoccaceae bacterium]|nr:hypothetical protein [Porticoccaceae bacterium]MDA8788762.1 hypothetical protein [Porticoccaceae bacterium]MDB2343258.1 hypothetical protein [Porticoccaceae bacterium]MDB2634082.1 hypothetical protein [Porticoccaceae bacterium]MDB2663917.1 hypothetical protein [Porticoccaceae bacterium]